LPADTEWIYPEEIAANGEEIEEEATMNNLLSSRFMQSGWFETPNLMDIIKSRFTEA